MTSKLSAVEMRRAERRLARALRAYLTSQGWHTFVATSVEISVEPVDVTTTSPGAYGRHQMVVQFTGGKFERHQRERGAHATRRVGRRP